MRGLALVGAARLDPIIGAEGISSSCFRFRL